MVKLVKDGEPLGARDVLGYDIAIFYTDNSSTVFECRDYGYIGDDCNHICIYEDVFTGTGSVPNWIIPTRQIKIVHVKKRYNVPE